MKIEKLVECKGSILLLGETGTGKSYMAKTIHELSDNRDNPFMAINLAAIQESLIESELFGHAKGAFTGATNEKRGYCREVGAGTLFLDEIGELSLSVQKKLLMLLEERSYSPVGSCSEYKFKGRIVAATNSDLRSMVENGSFREDLLYRLQVFSYKIPPIREDRKRLGEMVDYYLGHFQKIYQKKISLSDESKEFLLSLIWRGNTREIKNCMEYAVVMAKDVVNINDLPDWLSSVDSKEISNLREDVLNLSYHEAIEHFESYYLKNALESRDGQINRTTREISLNKGSLIAKARKYGINTLQMRVNGRNRELALVA